MKKIFKATAGVALAAVMTVSASASFVPAEVTTNHAAASSDDSSDDWLHAVGSRLYDKDGNEVWLTGANWFGFNCTENLAHGLYAADVDNFLSSVADHGINIIRMPISTELLLSWMNGKPLEVSSVNAGYSPPTDVVGEDGSVTKAGTYVNINKDFVLEDGETVKNSMEIFDVIMQKMKDYGLKVMIDVHSPASHNSGHNYNLWYYDPDAEDADNMAVGHFSDEQITWDNWKDSITWLAEKYSSDDTIIGYDLKNEPHGKRGYSGTTCPDTIAKWDGSTDLNNWAYSATECANSVLAVNPNALIFIEGVEQYPKTEKGYTYDTADIWDAPADISPWYGAWWGGNLRGVRNYPVVPDSGTSQIVYSPHDYGPSVYPQAWFYLTDDSKTFTEQTLLDDYWYDTWAYINAEEIAPLLIGEWGGYMDGAENQKWMELLRDYMINHHISHTFWCLNPNSGDTGGLLGYDFTTWDNDKYSLMEKSLWQTLDSGKYIGLDHQTALGSNGLSLSDFYANYAASEGSNLDGGTKTDGKVTSTTTTLKTTTTATTTTTTIKPTDSGIIYGDANCNEILEVADSVLILQSIANPDKYGLGGSDSNSLTEKGYQNSDCNLSRDGVTSMDALYVQQRLLNLITLPVD